MSAAPTAVSSLVTRSSAIAEGPRDASCQFKSCRVPRVSAELLVPQVLNKSNEVGGLRWALCNKHVHSTVTSSSRFQTSLANSQQTPTPQILTASHHFSWHFTCKQLCFFFTGKIFKLRLSLTSHPATSSPHPPSPPATPRNFSIFTPASESEVYKILSNCPNKQSDSDPIPTISCRSGM